MEFTATQIIKLAMLINEAEEQGDYAKSDAMQVLLAQAMKELA